MSELKARTAQSIAQEEEMLELGAPDGIEPELVYLKSEADKVIAHANYKRCLAMAKMCKARYNEEDAKENWCGLSWEYISKEMKYWERWQWRWEALAEKFRDKEA